jgi:hypothetical protein
MKTITSIRLPESFVKLIFNLNENFTKPSFKHFTVVLSGLLLGGSKKHITTGIRLTKPKGHFSNVHRFVSRYKWDIHQLTFSLFKLIQRCIIDLHRDMVFALDDTLVPKYGKKIFGNVWHFDHSSKPNRPKYIMGHNWVVMGLLHYCSVFSKWLCLPLLAELFVPAGALPKDRSCRSRIDIAVQMVDQIKKFVNTTFTLVADGLYAKKNLVRYCIGEDIVFISRLRSDASLYELPKPTSGRGRPRKYGKRLPSLGVMSKDPAGFETYHLMLYGERHRVDVKKVIGIWKPAGQPIQVLMVRFDHSKSFAYFFSTDQDLSVRRILTLVAARWSIETLFCDLKEQMGMKDWQVRIEGSVERSVPLTCVATTLLILWSLAEAGQKAPEFWDVQPWQTEKASPSVADMLHQLKARSLGITIIDILGNEGIAPRKCEQILQVLRQAA